MENAIDTKGQLEHDLLDLEINLQRLTGLLFIVKEYAWEKVEDGYDITGKDACEGFERILQSLEIIHEKLDASTDIIDRNIRHKIQDLIKAPVEGK